MFDELSLELRGNGKLTLNVKVTPKSAKTEFAGTMPDGSLRIRVAAAPEKGKANAELCSYLGKMLSVPKSAVRVQSGHASSRKRIVVDIS